MTLFGADQAGRLWDSVALPNAFICEYMPSAPEGYVKVYLYGLMYSRFPSTDDALTLASIAKDLGMEENEVTRAFQYWERCRLVNRLSDKPPQYAYLNVQQAVMGRQNAPADEQYMEFAQALYAIFGDKRKLHGGETQLCYEWIEQLGLPREVVLMMIQHLVSTRGISFGFKEAEKLAVELREHDIVTLDDAEQFFARSQSAWEGTQKILRRMSKFRMPTIDEIDLYLKWTKEWGFAPSAIERACKEMAGVSEPNFRYLDNLLRGVRERSDRKKTSADQLEKQLVGEKAEADEIREMLQAANIRQNANQSGVKAVYRDLRTRVPHELIVLAAEQVSLMSKNPSLDKIVELVGAWYDKDLRTAEDVRGYLALVQSENDSLRRLYGLMGYGGRPNQKDRELLRKWRDEWHFGDALLGVAAEYSVNAAAPTAFMNKVLENWRIQGIATVEAAREDHEKHRESYAAPAKQAAKTGKTVIEQRYEQREYDANDFGLSAEEIEEAKRL